MCGGGGRSQNWARGSLKCSVCHEVLLFFFSGLIKQTAAIVKRKLPVKTSPSATSREKSGSEGSLWQELVNKRKQR